MNESQPDSFFSTLLKGIAMGSADVVPGVSGGTVAYITGIYTRLLNAIHSIGMNSFIILKNDGIYPFWKKIDGKFLSTLFLGIGTSILSLSKVVLWGLENYAEIVWSFFFGLIIASIPLIFSQISRNIRLKQWLPFGIIGFCIGSLITFLPTANQELTLSYVLLSGFIAICAMILPGLSGSFILILLGSYKGILEGLHNLDWMLIITFISGALMGLIIFGRSLRYLFQKFPNPMTGIMGGFIIGSLIKIYPFKYIQSNGIEYPRLMTLEDPIILCFTASLIGFIFLTGLNKFAVNKTQKL
ncbi:MAG: Uncharacterised protein [Owenweeksia sp. TMED14]|nr:MAG: Uncharacterised protein [Owenweeksia sp. TMED14]